MMITLAEHLASKNSSFEIDKDRITKIECPECKELLHADYSVTLTSYPPCNRAWCNNCNWKWFI